MESLSQIPLNKKQKKNHPHGWFSVLELVMGVGPMNLVITNDALYQLSYTSDFATFVLYIIGRHFARLFLKIYRIRPKCCCLYVFTGKREIMRIRKPGKGVAFSRRIFIRMR